jgi:hypothetical protein
LYSKSRLSLFLILTTARLPVIPMPRPTFSHRKKWFDIIGVKFLPPVKSLVDLLPRPTALNKHRE